MGVGLDDKIRAAIKLVIEPRQRPRRSPVVLPGQGSGQHILTQELESKLRGWGGVESKRICA